MGGAAKKPKPKTANRRDLSRERLIIAHGLVEGLGLRARVNAELSGKHLLAALIGGQGRAALTQRRVGAHQAAVKFLGQRIGLRNRS